jgi:division protein CdvB (Snf7/Vps24/ESCRT-III family)
MTLTKRWNNNESQSQSNSSMTNNLFDRLKPQDPLKPRIEEAHNKLQMQVSKLEKISANLKEKDRLIFNRVVHSLQNHDSNYAKIVSNELSQVRKMIKMIDSAKLAFEQIQLRLNTITELGDVVVTLSPAMSVIKGIQGGLSSMMPQADQSFGQISDLLGSIMTESGQIPATAVNPEIITGTGLNDEAMKIIEEASAIIEEDTKSKFPDLPVSEDDVVKSSSSSKARQTSPLF